MSCISFLYNNIYNCTGDQLLLKKIDLLPLAAGLPYKRKIFVGDEDMLEKACQSAQASTLIPIAINVFVREWLPRPSESCQSLKNLPITNQLHTSHPFTKLQTTCCPKRDKRPGTTNVDMHDSFQTPVHNAH